LLTVDTHTAFVKDIGGEMVGCNNPDCKHGSWFRLTCLKHQSPIPPSGIAQTAGECQSLLIKDLESNVLRLLTVLHEN